MAHRTFTAPDGSEWQVWNVTPQTLETDERRGRARRQLDVPFPPPEKRKMLDRRSSADRRAHLRCRLVDADRTGWLVFQAGELKRRLLAVPADWEQLSEADLWRLWDAAAPVPPKP